MVTGASNSELALILVDARKGVLEQSRRHAVIATLLRIPHLVVCVNKMDLVDFSQSAFDAIVEEFTDFARKLEITDLTFIPVSALLGDNVVERSPNMTWYQGPPLLHHLETVHIASDRNLIDARFPVQYVLRPYRQDFHDYRGLAGTVAGGVFRPGDEVVALPSGFATTIASVDTFDGPLDEAAAGMSVAIRLADDLDISRGDMLCRPHNHPTVSQDIDAMVCWMTDRSPLKNGTTLWLKHTTRVARAKVVDLRYCLDINTLHRDETAPELAINDIGRIVLRTTIPLLYDEYRRNRTTGSFILIDESTSVTVGAGMILGSP